MTNPNHDEKMNKPKEEAVGPGGVLSFGIVAKMKAEYLSRNPGVRG
jgi:hypothetical protein